MVHEDRKCGDHKNEEHKEEYKKEVGIYQAAGNIKAFAKNIFGAEAAVISIVPFEKGWKAVVEMLLDGEYTKKYAKKDLVHVYEFETDNKAVITGYSRISIRERGEAAGARGGSFE